jgi:hypothetical protein
LDGYHSRRTGYGPVTTVTNVLNGALQRFYRVELVTYQSLAQPLIRSLSVQSLSVASNKVNITWSAVAGHVYRLQYKANLTDANWLDVLPDVTATGVTMTTTNIVGTAPQRFYRIWLRQ